MHATETVDNLHAALERIESLEHKLRLAEEALERIAKREGAFDRDQLEHAKNAIDSMEQIARAALAAIRSKT